MTRQNRRQFVAAVGATGLGAVLAGCTSDLGVDGFDEQRTDSPNDTPESNGTDGTDGTGPDGPGESLADFESFDMWRDLDEYGSFEAETDDVYQGSTALRMTADEDEPYVGVARAFSEPLDLTDRNVSLAIKANAPEFYRVELRLIAPDAGNVIHLNRTHTGPANTWLRADLGVTNETGDPDLSEIYEIQIVGRRHSREGAIDYLVDDVRTVEAPDRGMVMLSWDDSHQTHWDAFQIQREYGFPGVEGVIHHAVGASDRLDLDQLRQMNAEGWDVVSHPHPPSSGRSPLSEFDRSTQRRIVEESVQWLQTRGFENGARHYVTPGNVRDATNLELLREHHASSMSFGGAPTGVPTTDTYTIGRISGRNVDVVREYVDYAAEYNQLLVPMWHVLGDDGDVTEEEFRAILDYVDASDVQVVTLSDVVGDG